MIDQIGKDCTGCEACANKCPAGCISMIENAEGFWFPQINQKQCVGCNLCEKACPVLNPISIHKTEADVKVYALIHKDEAVRSASSSGGAFSAIAEYVLEQGGIVFGAAFDENFDVEHIGVEKKEDLDKLRGSKYVQSRIGDTYKKAKEYLLEGRLVFFTGTACQTSGLIGYLGRDYDNLITQDLICHGVPSPMVWRKYVKFREGLEQSRLRRVFFRDKSCGWHDWHILLQFENNNRYTENQREDLMVMSFLRGKCSRESCYDCKFKQKVRLADITLADYWGIEKILPELDDDKGVSSCYVNSLKGQKILDSIRDRVILKEMDLDTAISYNMAMVESEQMREDRPAFLKDMGRRPFDAVAAKYNGFRTKTKIRWAVRRILGNKTYDTIRVKLFGGKDDT